MKKIPLAKPNIEFDAVKSDIKKALDSGILTRGPYLERFESQLARKLSVRHVFATTSCTTALTLALEALSVKPGDEVLVADYSFPATGNVVIKLGAKPVFIDIDPITLCMDPEDLKKKINKKTKAIIVVHAFGYPADMKSIIKIAKRYNTPVIEDAACAIGSKCDDRYCGTVGDIGCFSFHPRKVITTGEGGAVITNSSKYAKRIELLRNHGGTVKNNRWKFIDAGYNFRMSELQAIIGLEQLKKLSKMQTERQRLAQYYISKLKNVDGIQLPRFDTSFNFQSFVIVLDKKYNRDRIIKKLMSENIETTLGTYAMHSHPAYKKYGYKTGDLPISYNAQNQTLTLPLYFDLEKKQQDYIIKQLKHILNLRSL